MRYAVTQICDNVLFNATATTNSLTTAIGTACTTGKISVHIEKVSGSAMSLNMSLRVELGDTGTYVAETGTSAIDVTATETNSITVPPCKSFRMYIVGDGGNGADTVINAWVVQEIEAD